MKLKLIVWHLNRDLAIARGLGSDTEHVRPLVGATCCHNERDEADAKRLWTARCYEPVALIDVKVADLPDSGDYHEALEFAFEKTNHINTAWNSAACRTHGVTALHYENNRSTSVGDFVEVIDGESSWVFLCMPAGFKRMAV